MAPVNGTGSLLMRAERVGKDTMLSQIVHMVAEAQCSRALIQKLADQLSGWFVPAVVLIAMDAEEMLLSLGAERVHTGNEVQEAMRLLDLDSPTFALIDVNVGNETSFPIADRLREADIPYVFATGYGDEADLPPEHRDCVVLRKPYTAATIAAAAADAVSRWSPVDS